MEPVTHMLTGAVLARTGLNRRAAWMTAAMVVAAEFPDIDTVWSALGPVTALEHHRGITHTFVALPVEAALLTAAFYLYHRLRPHPTKVSANWPWLSFGILIALLSHLLLDWTNNYGLRPFFPFNPHWYAGSFVFIFEPLLFLFLLAALVGPWLFGLINGEIGARRPLFRGRPSAIAACIAVAALYVLRSTEHAKALQIATTDVAVQRASASPYPLDPFTWHIVLDNGSSYQLQTLHTRTATIDPATPADTLYKSAPTLPILAAKRTQLGRIYLDWSQYPVLSETPDTTDPGHPLTTVTFADARFFYDTFFFHGRPGSRATPPLSGAVLLDMQAPASQRVVETTLNNRLQK